MRGKVGVKDLIVVVRVGLKKFTGREDRPINSPRVVLVMLARSENALELFQRPWNLSCFQKKSLWGFIGPNRIPPP